MNASMTSGDLSFSFNLAQPTRQRPPRYIARPFEAHPVGEQAMLLAAGDETAHRVPLFYAQALSHCDRFKPLDEHVASLMQAFAIPANQQPAVRQGLEGLVQRDLLRSEKRVFDQLGENQTATPAAPVETLCIRTCQRPADLLALLNSVGRHAIGAGLRRVLVLDDGPDHAASRASADAIRAATLPAELEIVHIDRTLRAQLIETVAATAGNDRAALRWLFEGDADDADASYGSNLNLALLLTAGQRFLMIDDDALLEPFQLQAPTPSLSLRIQHRFETRFPRPGENERAQYEAANINPLTAHGEILGSSIAALARQHGLQDGHLLRELSPQMIHEFSLRPRLRLTTNGTLGDSGTGDMAWLYSLPAEALQAWLAGPEIYRQQAFGRRVARATLETQIASSISLMTTTLTGVDNRELLLPVGAKGRGEDLMFGAGIRYLYPGTPCAALPWMLPHRLRSIRQWEPEQLFRRRGLSLSGYLADRIEDLIGVRLPADAVGRTQFLAEWMRALSGTQEDELVTDLRRGLLERRSTTTAGIQKTLSELDPPGWLRADFQRLLESQLQLGPEDSDALRGLATRVRRFAGAYGPALESWSRAWHRAAQTGLDKILESAQ